MVYILGAPWIHLELHHKVSNLGIYHEVLVALPLQLGRVEFGGRSAYSIGHIGLRQTAIVSSNYIPVVLIFGMVLGT